MLICIIISFDKITVAMKGTFHITLSSSCGSFFDTPMHHDTMAVAMHTVSDTVIYRNVWYQGNCSTLHASGYC